MTTLTLSRALNEGLRKALENNPKALIMGEDVGRLGGAGGDIEHMSAAQDRVGHRIAPPRLGRRARA